MNRFPKLHNAMWPGLVGKGSPGAEPAIGLDTMLNLTANASVDGARFDGVDLFLFDPHISIDVTDDQLKRLADKFRSKNLVVGSVVAPVWPPTGGGAAMGSDAERKQFVQQVEKGCRIAEKLRLMGVRPYGVVRIDSASSPDAWYKDPEGNQIEMFCDTPWYVPQPCGFKIDLDKSEDEVFRATEAYCREQPGFKPMEEWRAEISKKIAAQLDA